jgi:hypothetical protein
MRPSLLAALLAFILAAPAFGQTPNPVAAPDINKQHDVNMQSGNWVQAAVARESTRLILTFSTRSPSLRALQQPRQERGWIGRHPVLFGTLVGFGGGFLIGYLPGDDGVFDDFTAKFNGLVLGGVGAGVGAVSGAILAR